MDLPGNVDWAVACASRPICLIEEIAVAAEPVRPLDLDDLHLDVLELTAQGSTVESLTADSDPISLCICPSSCVCSGCGSSVLCSVS